MKRARTLTYLIFTIAILVGSWWLQDRWLGEPPIVLNGQSVTVIDGDSFRSGTDEYRIHGIDAPEYRQPCKDAKDRDWNCGKAARTALEQLMQGRQLSCAVQATDRFGRKLVDCKGDTLDIGAEMVRIGMAVSGDNFDTPIYGREEHRAEQARRGIWAGTFEHPARWRERNASRAPLK